MYKYYSKKYKGRYSPRKSRKFLKHSIKANRPLIVFAGANRGREIKLLRKHFMPDQNPIFHCFEADPQNWLEFKKNTSDIPDVFFYPHGLSDKEETMMLNPSIRYNKVPWNASSTFLTSLADQLKGKIEFGKQIPVSCITLNSWWSNINKPKIDLIRLDVEGWECKVMIGGEKVLRNTEHVLIETAIVTTKDVMDCLENFVIVKKFSDDVFARNKMLTTNVVTKKNAKMRNNDIYCYHI